jgi:hypothetical protein
LFSLFVAERRKASANGQDDDEEEEEEQTTTDTQQMDEFDALSQKLLKTLPLSFELLDFIIKALSKLVQSLPTGFALLSSSSLLPFWFANVCSAVQISNQNIRQKLAFFTKELFGILVLLQLVCFLLASSFFL